MNHYYTWHISFYRRWWKRLWHFNRDFYLDGGSVEWEIGPLTVERRINWRPL